MSDLHRHLDNLCAWLRELRPDLTWQRVVLAEALSAEVAGPVVRVPQSALIDPADYARRFEYLLEAGYAWINLHATGVAQEELVVLVELPRSAGRVPRQAVAINRSGPAAEESVAIV